MKRRPLERRFALPGCGIGINPRVNLVSDFREERQVVAAEALGFPPLVFDSVETGERRVITHAVLSLVQPDRSFDPTDAQFVHRCVLGFGRGWLLSGDLLSRSLLRGYCVLWVGCCGHVILLGT